MLQKAPYLLKYEARLTEKFIRKHIGDYSGYNHRQHLLVKLLETGFQEEHTATLDDYRSLCDYVEQVTTQRVESIDELVAIVLPEGNRLKTLDPNRLITLLYCLNIAAYDLQLCAELTSMFGYREAFNCHRRAVLKFIVDHSNRCEPTPKTPVSPILVEPFVNDSKNTGTPFKTSRLVEGIQAVEYERGELHRKWCALFLGFDYKEASTEQPLSPEHDVAKLR